MLRLMIKTSLQNRSFTYQNIEGLKNYLKNCSILIIYFRITYLLNYFYLFNDLIMYTFFFFFFFLPWSMVRTYQILWILSLGPVFCIIAPTQTSNWGASLRRCCFTPSGPFNRLSL